MPDQQKPLWRFAPTSGGYEQANSAGQFHFADNAYTKMVREVIQNSLDNPQEGLGPVTVTFELINLSPQDLFHDTLLPSIRAVYQELQDSTDREAKTRYANMENLLTSPRIPTLAIIDSNTTGLRPNNWQNLIFREGNRVNDPKQNLGGSFGFGKNAPFNISDLNTVIYSTRYLSVEDKGRCSAITGKSQLMSHTNPRNPTERLQHIGFLCNHQQELNQPIKGNQIPSPFNLPETGTGIFIVGFNQAQNHDWPLQTRRATVQNFFAAIDQGNLVVNIKPANGAPVNLTKHSLSTEIESLPPKSETRHFYKALHQTPQHTKSQRRMPNDNINQLEVRITTDPEAPRRLAHLNRRGMLITQSRQPSENPLQPHGGTTWSPWAAVTTATDDASDQFIRRMEPPAHDAIKITLLRDKYDQISAKTELRKHQEQIATFIKDSLEENNRNNATNVAELAELFPHFKPGGTDLNPRENPLKVNPDIPVDPEPIENELVTPDSDQDSEDEEDNTDRYPGSDTESANPDQPSDDAPNGPTQPKPQENPGQGEIPASTTIKNLRIIRTSPETLILTLTTPPDSDRPFTFGLKTAGEQYFKQEPLLLLENINQTGDITAQAELQENLITVQAPPQTQIILHITLSSPDQRQDSYRLAFSD